MRNHPTARSGVELEPDTLGPDHATRDSRIPDDGVPAHLVGSQRTGASGTFEQVGGQRALLRAWWEQVDQATRARLLTLGEGDFLPGDLALDAQMAGVSVIAVGTVLVDGGYEALYEQPDVLTDLLGHEREQG
ncbi:hypothetical protein ACFQ46_23380 [Kineococcus sp. GCM10028916]|uniref:hypothetical protein n=1 Tax=Kineococcus sp. GCM10028916 TaxID=3273394 RepID=UPI00363F9363